MPELPFVCLCTPASKEEGQLSDGKEIAEIIRTNSPDLRHVMFSLNGDFLDYSGVFESIHDMWFWVTAKQTQRVDGIKETVKSYSCQTDDPELGWRQIWRELVANEGPEKFLERSEYFFDDWDDYDFTKYINWDGT